MFTDEEKRKIEEYYSLAMNRITSRHIGCFKGHSKPVFLISDTYPGVWLEHAYDSVCFAKIDPDYLFVAKNTLDLFLDNQKKSGQLPCFAIDMNKGPGWPEYGFSQLQECVSFGRLCYEYYRMSADGDFLAKAYEGCRSWVDWLKKYRMPGNHGLVEMFGTHDTGHDNSGRWQGVKYEGCCRGKNAENYPDGDEIMPIIAPDVNAVYYGDLCALSDMATELGDSSDAEYYKAEAQRVKYALIDMCYDEDDGFFYDVDKNGNKRKYLSISITNIFAEHMLDSDMMDRIYQRHLKCPDEFWTDYPFPAMAASDASFCKNRSGNSWGYYSQALTILRCSRWMDYYGKGNDYDTISEKWLRQWTFGNDIMFGQELDPFTGVPSDCSEWYSSCMLLYILAARRLGIVSDNKK